jgi:hypothetical protein
MTPVDSANISTFWPDVATVPDTVTKRAREYLTQAMESASAGAVVLAASAVDAMLKDKGYKDGNLYSRIDKAAADHLITPEMAEWAHEVRLDANDQRHADENAALPSKEEADKSIAFAQAVGQFLYVLPAMVKRGRKAPATTVTGSATHPSAGLPGTTPKS